MRIKATQRFKSGRDVFEKDDEFTLADEPMDPPCSHKPPCASRPAHFVRAGWAVEVGAEPVPVDPPSEVTLDIQSASHQASDSNG